MKLGSRTTVLLVTSCAVLAVGAAPAQAAAPGGGPSTNASCIGTIFVPQATGEPGTVAARIAFIKEFILPALDINVGEPISGLARAPKDDCAGD